ncbi:MULTISPECIES: ferredoxin [unclassified Pseudonocardia]|uniref:ferredoxin n=1 Tax=unclassified Pseudonocardia TaxID=2619320 RepID=UPI000962968C|nr:MULTISPECIES: ferredoxin [unclassified Pseudonocardia]MBN9097839.1 ferredoxin family protein [Pseudonocardia sp.]OJY49179.1 MAG: ferredoxin [Pseudonocardia sp. 73-21]
MAFVIGGSCVDVKDKSCIEECPVDCIYEGGRMMYIHPTECIDCAACEPVCPVEAIVSAQQATEPWRLFQASAKAMFDEVGSPGGSSNIDHPLTDTDFVAGFEKDDD